MSSARLTGLRDGLARLRGREIEVKTPGELDVMRVAGAVVARTLAALTAAARPGVSTAELDELAEERIRDAGAIPSFYGYLGYPASICTSVNEQIVHGIPSATQVLADGDLVSIDCGAIVDGWHGDAAVTVEVGSVSDADRALSAACRDALQGGIAAVRVDARLTDISAAVQQAAVEAAGATAPVTASSQSTAGTESAARCTWSRSCRISARRGAGRGCGRAWCWPSSRCSPQVPPDHGAGRRVDGGDRRRVARGALGAQRGRHRGRPMGAHRAAGQVTCLVTTNGTPGQLYCLNGPFVRIGAK